MKKLLAFLEQIFVWPIVSIIIAIQESKNVKYDDEEWLFK